MKRFTKFIQEFSLTQQLLVIIFVYTLTFVGFIVTLLSPNITQFVEAQIYTVMELSQSDLVNAYETQNSIKNYNTDLSNYNMGHIIIGDSGTQYLGVHVVSPDMLDVLIDDSKKQVEESKRYYLENKKNTMYYTILKHPSVTIITYMYESFGIQVRNALLNSIVNTTVFVVFALFILLLLWMVTIITPLRQIRLFIDKLKVGQKADLKVNRKDEIGDLANALVALSEEIEYQEQIKTQLIHNISHDLKTPIATIKSYAESIKDGIYPYETLEKSVDVIIEHANRLEKKVHSLLLLNRLSFEDNEMVNDIDDVDMQQVIEAVCLAIKVIKPNIEFVCDLKPAIFKGNYENWRVSVENIVDNALRYAKTKIWITLKENELVIENDGPAIPDDKLKAIFKAYEKGTDGNFGLGLSIAYKVAISSGYYIEAMNTEKGVAFKIHKPKF